MNKQNENAMYTVLTELSIVQTILFYIHMS